VLLFPLNSNLKTVNQILETIPLKRFLPDVFSLELMLNGWLLFQAIVAARGNQSFSTKPWHRRFDSCSCMSVIGRQPDAALSTLNAYEVGTRFSPSDALIIVIKGTVSPQFIMVPERIC
jgi:hypothetical protein